MGSEKREVGLTEYCCEGPPGPRGAVGGCTFQAAPWCVGPIKAPGWLLAWGFEGRSVMGAWRLCCGLVALR